ncbi:MAG: exodeoxyribonuclease VII small subunit [Methylotenera sp.]|nr:exodeoxyribonuclease VII small subunit [Methylotenera sp.]MDP1755600.1 exodeoxyribonuclease VII small subunit [Methylotenera sp.]MDP1959686.1 exodeoxyribonuclease VII small subunit [Methylotenera sp.]MDP3207169.1 exodeoxyribonuclease VII small subunit [Methylotenera sp.]MDP3304234.1 exodeoxyribonuclease VII small subunit [Methylotenera sp.]
MSASTTKTASKSAATAAHESNPSFEQAYSELENIVAQMESGLMPLDASLEAYKQGNALLELCQKSLAEVEQQVKVLNERQQLVAFNADNE